MPHKEKAEDFEELGKKLGAAIARQRKACGLTQDDLATLVEVDSVTISRFERGMSVPSLHRLLAIAQALQTSASELLSEASPLPGDRAKRLSTVLRELGSSDQQLLMDIAGLLQRR